MTEFKNIEFTDKIDKNNLLYYAKHYKEKNFINKAKKAKKRKK